MTYWQRKQARQATAQANVEYYGSARGAACDEHWAHDPQCMHCQDALRIYNTARAEVCGEPCASCGKPFSDHAKGVAACDLFVVPEPLDEFRPAGITDAE